MAENEKSELESVQLGDRMVYGMGGNPEDVLAQVGEARGEKYVKKDFKDLGTDAPDRSQSKGFGFGQPSSSPTTFENASMSNTPFDAISSLGVSEVKRVERRSADPEVEREKGDEGMSL